MLSPHRGLSGLPLSGDLLRERWERPAAPVVAPAGGEGTPARNFKDELAVAKSKGSLFVNVGASQRERGYQVLHLARNFYRFLFLGHCSLHRCGPALYKLCETRSLLINFSLAIPIHFFAF